MKIIEDGNKRYVVNDDGEVLHEHTNQMPGCNLAKES